jgi:hypothetical protein
MDSHFCAPQPLVIEQTTSSRHESRIASSVGPCISGETRSRKCEDLFNTATSYPTMWYF